MSKIHLRIPVRVIKNQKGYVLINVLGMALGMALSFLVLSFILAELSYDRYHQKADRLYRITSNLTLGGTPNLIATTNAPPATAMVTEFEGVTDALRLRSLSRVHISFNKDKEFYEDQIYYAEPSIFRMFTFPMVKGNPETALAGARSIVITETMAHKYFNDADPMGEVLRLNDQTDYTVTGIIKDVPSNSHFTFDILLSYETLYQTNGREPVESWSSPFYTYSYILLDENQDAEDLRSQLPGLVDKYVGDSFKSFGASVEYYLQPITEVHLHSTQLRHEISVHSDIKYVYIFASIAFFVLLIACFNFMNLATARSSTRAKEVGLRKILGAGRTKLILRFLIEAVFYSLVSLAIAIVLAYLTLPIFSSIAGISLKLDFTGTLWLLPSAIALAILVGLLAGIYPAIFLSSFPPTQALSEGRDSLVSGSLFRKVLVIVQFTISIILIICTLTVFKQLQFLKTKDLGFNREQVIIVPIMDTAIRNSLEVIKAKLLEDPNILSAAAASHVPGQRPSGGTYQPEGYGDGETVMMDGMSVDYDYIETMGMAIAKGRNFSADFPADAKESILITETAAREIGWEDALNKIIKRPGQENGKTVIGVVNDFFFKSPHKAMRGIYISYSDRPYRAVFIKISSENIPSTIENIENVWKEFDPNRSLDYYFLDESYDKQYQADERLGTIVIYFTFFAIFIACLGLFGMSTFATEQRVKEIGIRKSLGATTSRIVALLLSNIIKTLLISFFVGLPIAYYVMSNWLQNFAYRTGMNLYLFLLAVVITMTIAILTVSIQSIRAALANPVDSLRNK